jgi:hypothetical protein
MKPTNPTLNALLASRQFNVADLYTITLVGGTVLRYCSGGSDIIWGSNKFLCGGSTGPYFDRKSNRAKVTWKIGSGVDSLVLDIAYGSSTILGVPFPSAVRNGFFDGATFQLERAFMATYGNLAAGTVIMFAGRVAEVDCDRLLATMTVNCFRELLAQNMPRNLFQSGCMNTLFDPSCNIAQPQPLSNFISCSRAAPATSYAKTSAGKLVSFAANAPRITDLGLLVEPSSTNLLLQSNDFFDVGGTPWLPINGGGGFAVQGTWQPGGVIAPDGTASAGTLLYNDGYIQQEVAGIAAGTTYTDSIYFRPIKFNAGNSILLGPEFDLNHTASYFLDTGVISAAAGVIATIETFVDGWLRFAVTWSSGAYSGPGDFTVTFAVNGPPPKLQIQLWGAQREALGFLTTYIPTTSATVTRSADLVSALNQLDAIVNTSGNGTLFANSGPTSNLGSSVVFGRTAASGSGIGKVLGRIGGTTPPSTSIARENIDTNVSSPNSIDWTATQTILTACAFGPSGTFMALNGEVSANAGPSNLIATSITYPSFCVGFGGATAATGNFYNGYIRRISGWNYQLPPDALQSITASGSPPSPTVDLNFAAGIYYGVNAYAIPGVVQPGSTASSILANLAQASGYFNNGKLIFTSGANIGIAYAINTWTGGAPGTLTLISPAVLPVSAGDTFTVYAGCDRTLGAGGCSKFANTANFRGFPFTPAPETAL